MADHPIPSARAIDLVKGAYDVHLHIAPDVMKRRITDLELAPRFQERGMAGFVLKSHYVPTAERASLVRASHPQVDALGAITLNGSVGGMNAVAVEIAGRGGAQFVWLPTVDSENQRSCLAEEPEGAKPPMWAQLQNDLADAGIQSPTADVLDAAGEVTDDTLHVLDVIAKYDMTLATGHLHGDESAMVIEAAHGRGVRRIVVTHPEFTSQKISAEAQVALTSRGALLERCLTTPLTGKVAWDVWLHNIRAAGPEYSVISSDLGQPFNPPVEDGMAIVADVLLEDGFTEEEIRVMAVHNSRWLAGADPLPDAPEAHRTEAVES